MSLEQIDTSALARARGSRVDRGLCAKEGRGGGGMRLRIVWRNREYRILKNLLGSLIGVVRVFSLSFDIGISQRDSIPLLSPRDRYISLI